MVETANQRIESCWTSSQNPEDFVYSSHRGFGLRHDQLSSDPASIYDSRLSGDSDIRRVEVCRCIHRQHLRRRLDILQVCLWHTCCSCCRHLRGMACYPDTSAYDIPLFGWPVDRCAALWSTRQAGAQGCHADDPTSLERDVSCPRNQESTSTTLAVVATRDPTGTQYHVYYVFENRRKAEYTKPGLPTIYRGVAIMSVGMSGTKTLSGEYFTDQPTNGIAEFKLERHAWF